MKKIQIRNTFTKIHFYLLGLGIINFLIKKIIGVSLNYQLAYIITVLIYISGIILFFWYLKPFKKLIVYFSLYIFTLVQILLFWMFGGIFFAILASIVLFPIWPKEKVKAEKKFRIYEDFQGFFIPSNTYVITEKQLELFEKEIKEVNLHGQIHQNNSFIRTRNGRTELKVNFSEFEFLENNSEGNDTIILLKSK